MGPRLFRRGNDTPGIRGGEVGGKLQWGHAFSGVETSLRVTPGNNQSLSFNGATPFQAWKLKERIVVSPRASMLQWGHAFSGVETRWMGAYGRGRSLLQWGHAFSGVETGIVGPRYTGA